MSIKIAFVASQSKKAQSAYSELTKRYGNHDMDNCDVIVSLGGDGFLLETLHKICDLKIFDTPVYGMNCGTVGFLLNKYNADALDQRIFSSKKIKIHPLKMVVETFSDEIVEKYAFNDIQIYRQSSQAAKFEVKINNKVRIKQLVGDGIILSSPAGSTSYNSSAGGPIVPLGANVLPLTPICAFRPRSWKGALLPNTDNVEFDIHEAKKRPVIASADAFSVENVKRVTGSLDQSQTFKLLFESKNCLEERVFAEQFP